jgi:putative DNA primase/helicase
VDPRGFLVADTRSHHSEEQKYVPNLYDKKKRSNPKPTTRNDRPPEIDALERAAEQYAIQRDRPALRAAVDTDKPSWRDVLKPMKGGGFRATIGSVAAVLANDPDWLGVLAHNDFKRSVVALKAFPCRPGYELPGEHREEPWDMADIVRACDWFEWRYGMHVSVPMMTHSLLAEAKRLRFHPVREYLEGLKWDGVERLNSFCSNYLGAKHSRVTEAAGRKWLIAAIARVMRPGSKVDSVLVLEGSQGIGKSTALNILGGSWFMDSPIAMGSKEGSHVLQGSWIIEMSELDAMRGREITEVKAFLTRREDKFRPAYEKANFDFPRQCIFAATTNEEEYLGDVTGNRRFWPVMCGRIDLEKLKLDRDQIWAEALEAYNSGEAWHIQDPSLSAAFSEEQSERATVDGWDAPVESWARGEWLKNSASGFHFTTIVGAAKAVDLEPKNMRQGESSRLARCLKRLGYKKHRPRTGEIRQWGWRIELPGHV